MKKMIWSRTSNIKCNKSHNIKYKITVGSYFTFLCDPYLLIKRYRKSTNIVIEFLSTIDTTDLEASTCILSLKSLALSEKYCIL